MRRSEFLRRKPAADAPFRSSKFFDASKLKTKGRESEPVEGNTTTRFAALLGATAPDSTASNQWRNRT
jgi:hypothetical protein